MHAEILPGNSPFDLTSLRSFRRVALCCPARPNADAIAAGYALYRYFTEQGCTPLLFYSGGENISEPGPLEMLSCLNIPLHRQPEHLAWDGLRIMVGHSDTSGSAAPKTVIFDNHVPVAPLECEHDIRPHLTACSTLMWDLLRKAGFSIDQNLAAGLLYGLYSASNGFSEIRFPLDRDMRDSLPHNKPLFDRLKRSCLRMEDLYHAAEALQGLQHHAEDGVLLINVLPGEPGVLRFLSDLALRVHGVDLALAFCETVAGVRFSLSSGTREIKASDLTASILAEGTGNGGGDREKGGGVIKAQYPALTQDAGPLAFFQNAIRAHRGAYGVLDCHAEKPPAIGTLRAYQKRPITQAFVRCSRVFPKRSQLHIRMLEGDITLEVTPQTYLMIGIAGEVYPISLQTFTKAYTLSDTSPLLDTPYAPAVLDGNGGRVELMAHAETCVSREGRVLARQLERGVKVFTRWDRESYILGEPGDWLICRKDNPRGVYIIKEHLFPRLYEAVARPDGSF